MKHNKKHHSGAKEVSLPKAKPVQDSATTDVLSVSVGSSGDSDKAKGRKGFFGSIFSFLGFGKKTSLKDSVKTKVSESGHLAFEVEKISKEKPEPQGFEETTGHRGILAFFYYAVMASLNEGIRLGKGVAKLLEKAKRLSGHYARRRAALKAWRERKKKAEKILNELNKLKEKEMQRHLSEQDFIEKKNLGAQLSELKAELHDVSNHFESNGMHKPAGLQIVLGEISKYESPAEKIEFYKKLQRQVEIDFYKRRISEDEFRKTFLDYDHKIRELELKKVMDSKKPEKTSNAETDSAGAFGTGGSVVKKSIEAAPIQSGTVVIGSFGGMEIPKSRIQNSNSAARERGMVFGTSQIISEPKTSQSANMVSVGTGQNISESKSSSSGNMVFGIGHSFSEPKISRPDETVFVGSGKNVSKPQVSVLAKGQNVLQGDVSKTNVGFMGGGVMESDKNLQSNFSQSGQSAVQSRTSSVQGTAVDEKKLLNKMGKLVDLMEEERNSKSDVGAKPKIVSDSIDYSSVGQNLKTIQVEGIEMELSHNKIVSDFDRLLDLVKEKGSVKETEAMAFLDIKKSRFDECCSILEQSNLVNIEYPPLGGMIVTDVNFVDSKKKGV